jgi:biofilm PGA synthesis N-glycosyltransferase PgaC
MEPLTILYLVYTFIAFYFLTLHALIYIQNKKQIYEIIPPNKTRTLSIVIPCYNEEKSIARTIQAHIDTNYQGLKQIIVSDDCSTDTSPQIIKQFQTKYPNLVKYVKTPKQTGNAAGAKNYGAQFVTTELIGFSDSDSIPKPDTTTNMIGYFNDPKVGAITSRVLVKGKQNYLTRSQAIEYKIIAFTRKILGFIDSIYVTNGPQSIYRKTAFDQIGGFDKNNLTEDIEITWNFVAHGWKIKMAIPAIVYTYPPTTIKQWFKQRIRWNVGGIQTVAKYRKKIAKCGMLGLFIMPYFTLSWILGITGLFFMTYRLSKYIITKILVAKYSVAANVALIQMDNFTLNPSILFYFGMLLFTLGMTYSLTALFHSRKKGEIFSHPIRDIFIYSIFYLIMYPPLLIWAFYKYARGYNEWGTK